MSPYRKWHRRLGIFIAAFLVLFVTSGILLQHTSWLKLDRSHLPANLAQFLYGVTVNTVTTYKTADRTLSHIVNFLYLDNVYVPHVEFNELRGVVADQSGIWIAADGHLWLISSRGELLDKLSTVDGLLPENVVRIGAGEADGSPVIAGLYQKWRLENDSLNWQAHLDGQVVWSKAEPPENLAPEKRNALLADAQGRLITWERLVLDLHSGRLLGAAGVVFVDVVSLLMLLAAVTGTIIWIRKY